MTVKAASSSDAGQPAWGWFQRSSPFQAFVLALPGKPWFAYGTLFVLQLRRMWGILQFRDVTTGDTCSYLHLAWRWLDRGQVNFAWSPLYTAFYGLVLRLTPDAALANLLHRYIIAMTASLLVLAVLRRIFPAALAWMIAAWWAVMPINFDTMYEIHLFALLPILLAWLAVAGGNAPWRRGAAIGVLLVDAVLVRNEMIVAAIVFAVTSLIAERMAYRRRAPSISGSNPSRIVVGYMAPILVSVAIIGFFYSRSYIKSPALVHEFHAKHTLDMGQAFAFGYQQRHPGWTKNAMRDYGELCQSEFGTPEPTFSQILRRNPRAYAAHVLWNARLVPNGLQLMLFSATSGSIDPDYAGQHLAAFYPIPLSVLVIICIVAAVHFFNQDRRRWTQLIIHPHLFVWMAMLAVSASSMAAIVTQRPRPSYVFGLTLTLMVLIGACALILSSRVRTLARLAPLMPVFMLGLALCVPSHYRKHTVHRNVFDEYEQLKPYEALFEKPGAAFVGPNAMAMGSYLGHGNTPCFDYVLFDDLPEGMSLADFLSQRGITIVNLNQDGVHQLEKRHPGIATTFFQTHDAGRWKLLAEGSIRGNKWMIYSRMP